MKISTHCYFSPGLPDRPLPVLLQVLSYPMKQPSFLRTEPSLFFYLLCPPPSHLQRSHIGAILLVAVVPNHVLLVLYGLFLGSFFVKETLEYGDLFVICLIDIECLHLHGLNLFFLQYSSHRFATF